MCGAYRSFYFEWEATRAILPVLLTNLPSYDQSLQANFEAHQLLIMAMTIKMAVSSAESTNCYVGPEDGIRNVTIRRKIL